MEVSAEQAIISYVNMHITAMTEKEEEDFLTFLNRKVVVKPVFEQLHGEGEDYGH